MFFFIRYFLILFFSFLMRLPIYLHVLQSIYLSKEGFLREYLLLLQVLQLPLSLEILILICHNSWPQYPQHFSQYLMQIYKFIKHFFQFH